MLRKVAVALIAATMFTAPVLAQGLGGANSPAAAQPAKATHPKPAVGTSAPTIKGATTVKASKAHRLHVRAAKHVKHVKHAKAAKHAKFAKPGTSKKHVRHLVRARQPQVARPDGKPMARSN